MSRVKVNTSLSQVVLMSQPRKAKYLIQLNKEKSRGSDNMQDILLPDRLTYLSVRYSRGGALIHYQCIYQDRQYQAYHYLQAIKSSLLGPVLHCSED